MANNTTLAVPSGSSPGDPIRSQDRAGIKTQVVLLDLGGAGAESLVTGTMPVSGSITVANASLAVTGTFWQVIQPVSGTVTVGNASLAVTGAFFQTTQPVSAASLPLPTGAATETTLAALNTKVTAVNTGAVVISGALPAGAAVIGALTANQTVNNAQINGVVPLMGNGITGTGSQRVTIASDNAAITVSTAAAPATYSAAVVGLASALTATDIFTITGSATKTVRVSRIMVNGVQTTAAQVNMLLIKRSTANSAGTSTAPTRVAYDSTSAAATATVLAYTANPTLGTALGTASASRAFIPGAATASDAQGLEIVSGDVGQQMMTLRGIAEVLGVNLNGTTIAGSAFNITVEWTES